MKKIKALSYYQLRKKINSAELGFKTTKEIKSLSTEFIYQERALEALTFGIGIQNQGYNLYVMGPSGVGKRSLVNLVLAKCAKKQTAPPDWCYIYNFDVPEQPIAIKLPTGLGHVLQNDMKLLVTDLSKSIVSIFESDEYQSNIKKISRHYDLKRKRSLKSHSRSKIDKASQLYKEQHEKEKEFELMSLATVVKPIINSMRKKYLKYPAVITYLSAVQNDVLNNVNEFVREDEKTHLFIFLFDNPALTKYKINLFIDNSKLQGAPIVVEEAPSYSTLICRIEHTSQLGILVTNLTLIKPGALHRANGGYLIIEARKLRKNHEAWEALKTALYSGEIQIKNIDPELDSVKPISLEPMAIPLNVKVILLGDRNTYYHLSQHDPDFDKLFKVAVDFDEEIIRNNKNIQLYARIIATIVRREKLKPFHVHAVAAIIDYSSRMVEDTEKLSTRIRNIQDLILESAYWASTEDKNIVDANDVKRAMDAQIYRMDRTKHIYYESIARDFIIINTTGKAVGQINCLSVRRVGNYSYGHPTRVTARIHLGHGKLIDIQREIKMAGPFHSKASLIINHYLASHFNKYQPFSLHVSLSFEQIYCWTDGDSAAIGELCAILSVLAGVPLQQAFAITGSLDQYGEVQAVGGVNEKVEGFFDICKIKGLTGKQGVIIPAANVANLMLRDEILEAAKAGKFFIYPITTIDDALKILTGLKIGVRNKKGHFPKNTLYYKVEKRLQRYTKNRIKKRV